MLSVYISHVYNNFSLTWKEAEAMAQQMRHDPRTAQHKCSLAIEKTKTAKAKHDRIKQLEA